MEPQDFAIPSQPSPSPVDPGSLPSLGSLGSLGQQARLKSIKTARTVLIVVGTLSLLGGLVLFFVAESAVDGELRKELAKYTAEEIDQTKLAEVRSEAVAARKLGAILTIGEATAFLLLGFFVQKAPVPVTATGLILYLADWAIGSVYDPMYIVNGLIIKVIIVVCLVKALQSAIAYERENKVSAAFA